MTEDIKAALEEAEAELHAEKLTRTERILKRCWMTSDGCVVFPGNPSQRYGVISYQNKPTPVHRIIYEDFIGPAWAGLIFKLTSCLIIVTGIVLCCC